MAKDTYLKKILGEECFNRIHTTKVVMIGAGGIGCELLKDLVLTGYGEIHIVDLDTITLSNLNRQFLFRQKDIDKSKSLTVSKAVESFNYLGVKLVPHHGNVMDTKQFPIEWWGQFSFIFNALDNLEARSYVNRMALFVKRPLMEMNVLTVSRKKLPIVPRVYDQVDSITACSLYNVGERVFIPPVREFGKEANELIELRTKILNSTLDEFIKDLITKIYKVDIGRLSEIESLWKDRPRPTPLELSEHQDVVCVGEYLCVVQSGQAIQNRLTSGKELFVSFDKDDEDTMIFVAAASNLRSWVFGIPVKSKFDIKQIAGNIIPAIATTNALIAGLSSLAGTEYYQYQTDTNSSDFSTIASRTSSCSSYVTGVKLSDPDPKCASDSLTSRGVLSISGADLATVTLGELVDRLEPNMATIKKTSRSNSWVANGEIVLVQDDDDQLENLQLYVNISYDQAELELPDLKLRTKRYSNSPNHKSNPDLKQWCKRDRRWSDCVG
ncbi:Ubiquitin-activating enzyme E1-like [Candida viswanathii]|uniref:Ubiquitin-activating enzyme E1-like n=1 Tax=Candida viswanathii TaxID=5486 RepID=A0A367XQ54_9ASCO|nr:Ubiquitin-activating enzyme E1-like [Candida viswanathii]